MYFSRLGGRTTSNPTFPGGVCPLPFPEDKSKQILKFLQIHKSAGFVLGESFIDQNFKSGFDVVSAKHAEEEGQTIGMYLPVVPNLSL